MTRLEELIISLATVIVRYHDNYNPANVCIAKGATEALTNKGSFDYSRKLLENNDLQGKLERLIKACPQNDRGPFLDFIKNEAVVLKELRSKTQPFTSEEFTLYQKQLTQLLVDFFKLLETNKTSTHQIQCNRPNGASPVKISLGGLINVGYGLLPSSLCKSGQLLTEEILNRFNLANVEEASAWAKELCTEHQNSLLAAKMSAVNEKNSSLEQEIQSLKDTQQQHASEHLKQQQQSESELKQSKEETQTIKTLYASLESKMNALQIENTQLRAAQTSSAEKRSATNSPIARQWLQTLNGTSPLIPELSLQTPQEPSGTPTTGFYMTSTQSKFPPNKPSTLSSTGLFSKKAQANVVPQSMRNSPQFSFMAETSPTPPK